MGTVSYAVLSQTLQIFQVSKPNIRQFPSLEMPLGRRAFPNASPLPSTNSAARLRALFAGFVGTMEESDFSRPCIIGYGLFGLPDADHG